MDLNSWPGQIAVGVVSDLLGASIIAAFLAAVYTIFRRAARSDLEHFFGIDKASEGSVQIYLSNIHVRPEGAQGVTPIKDGFTGPAITQGEYEAALELAHEIENGPIRRLSRIIRDLVAREKLDVPNICNISVAPSQSAERADFDRRGLLPTCLPTDPSDESTCQSKLFNAASTVVLIGSPVYNSLSDYITRHPSVVAETHFRFYREVGDDGTATRGITFFQGGSSPGRAHKRRILEAEERSLTGPGEHFIEYFIIERLRRVQRNGKPVTILVCAGTGTAATVAAVRKLLEWREFQKRFQDSPFAIMYKLETNDKELVLIDGQDRFEDIPDDPVEVFPRRTEKR